MCPSISAISDRSFRGSVSYCMPMVLNIKEHEQFFKKCVQKMLTTALGAGLADFIWKIMLMDAGRRANG